MQRIKTQGLQSNFINRTYESTLRNHSNCPAHENGRCAKTKEMPTHSTKENSITIFMQTSTLTGLV